MMMEVANKLKFKWVSHNLESQPEKAFNPVQDFRVLL